VFGAGINWGLPSRAVDPFLFGDRPVWTGAEIAQLAPQRNASATRGADVDVNPIRTPAGTLLNETDAQRAEIVRRYRLFTHQPDEMITLMSLASMRPGEGDFDPKLYQYGGLWIYPVGAMLRVAGAVGFVHLTSDSTYYLNHPEDFGRFYIVARSYTVLWGLVGVWAVFWIVRRLTSNLGAAAAAALCFIFMPVVVNMAHEAKPHLPGTVLMLLAVIAASKYADVGGTRWWVLAGALCGLAMGMVISSLPIFVILPVMTMFRRERLILEKLGIMLAAGAVGGVAYFVVNPYVAINLVANQEVLRSNLANSTAMYNVGQWGAGLRRSVELIVEGASALVALVGALAIVAIIVRTARRGRLQPLIFLLLMPVVLLMCQFIALAAGKPGEYGRFALFIDVALAIGAVACAALVMRNVVARSMFYALLILFVAVPGVKYMWGFMRDAGPNSTRLLAAERIEALRHGGATTLAVGAEPAPYSVPPVNLFEWKILLRPPAADVSVLAHESNGPWDADISWASKPFRILINDPTLDQEMDQLIR
jgi:hypothetical protein